MRPKTGSTDTPLQTLYETVTERIIALIEKGVAPWKRTWSVYGLAKNYATGHVYTGINFMLMNNTEHPIPYFMTFRQVKERGGKVKKGAKAEMVFYFNVFYKDEIDQTLTKHEASARREAGEEIQVLKFLRYYNVFNIADIEGIEFEIKELEMHLNEKIERCEKILWDMPKCPEIRNSEGDQPFYTPEFDYINIPTIERFETGEDYYATLFHELIHATGHASRLFREEVMNFQFFGSASYCREELVAEMGASFLCSTAQIDYDSITEDNAAYLAGWLKVLREDTKFIFKAAAEAQKAADYILDWRPANG